jgi:hypothetical protein
VVQKPLEIVNERRNMDKFEDLGKRSKPYSSLMGQKNVNRTTDKNDCAYKVPHGSEP